MKKSNRQGYRGESWKQLEHIIALGYSRSNVFSDWLDLMLAAFLSLTDNIRRGNTLEKLDGAYEQRYMDIIGRYASNCERGQRPADYFAAAYSALLDEVEASTGDPLGDMYMKEITYGEHGQFFTPQPVADMMAALTGTGETVCDPSCGSGVMFIAAAKQNPRVQCLGIDLDTRCAKMCALNMLFRGLTADIYNGDALRLEMRTLWKVRGFGIVEVDNPAPPVKTEPQKQKPDQAALF